VVTVHSQLLQAILSRSTLQSAFLEGNSPHISETPRNPETITWY
jgi:hypothetical protein